MKELLKKVMRLNSAVLNPAPKNGSDNMLFFALAAEKAASESRPEEKAIDHLLHEIALGNTNALEELYIKTKSAVYGAALSILKNHHQAEDVLQDTYIKIMSAAGSYEKGTKPMAWIMTIARNLALMKIREKNRYTDMPENYEVAVDSHEAQFENKAVLSAALKVLSEEETSIVMMHCVSGMKHREIADVMSLPLSTVLSKYNRALKKLKNELKEVI